MQRCDFIAALGGVAIARPLAAVAQQSDRTRRVGVVINSVATDTESQSYLDSRESGGRSGHLHVARRALCARTGRRPAPGPRLEQFR
jgi:hypothetical protein